MLKTESASLLTSMLPDLEEVRLIPADNLHVTLCFLGNVADDQRERLLLSAARLDGVSTVADICELTGYPSPSRATTIVATLTENPLLFDWRNRFLDDWPGARSNHQFAAHITLARSRHRIRVPQATGWSELKIELMPPEVYVSTTLATGAIYTRLSDQG